MTNLAKSAKATIIPCLRYRDAPTAIEWLCQTLGFEKHLVVPNDDGTVAHAQLNLGNGMIMLGSVVASEIGRSPFASSIPNSVSRRSIVLLVSFAKPGVPQHVFDLPQHDMMDSRRSPR